ncbi:hypothetical protein HOLleu_42759 [Holothuria leucospilota]|uniref:Transcriptional coactivator p15 (PC4) C-terminal domain-containing protein n=1 Tax=Holothuria leucospilota TaxID=206669 RepID=A0A9Q1BBG0_HOLLE|nr:hypothetical protein HOLleu_42759 [Holothuria leucospilota]
MAENMSTVIKTNIRELRRLNAVPLDLGVRKRINLEEEEETNSAVPLTPVDEITQPSWPTPKGSSENAVLPTPSDENAQPSWPNREGSSEASSLMNVSPLEENRETGTDTVSKPQVLFTLEENRKVSVKTFKNREYVCVRDFYQVPESKYWHAGLKGLNLNVLEWDRLKLLASNMNYLISSSKDLFLSDEMRRFSLQPDYSDDDEFTGYCRKVKMMYFCT